MTLAAKPFPCSWAGKAEYDNQIPVIAMEQNAAVVNARNVGSKETKGEYIPLYGPDDPWVGGKLDPQFALAEKRSVDG